MSFGEYCETGGSTGKRRKASHGELQGLLPRLALALEMQSELGHKEYDKIRENHAPGACNSHPKG